MVKPMTEAEKADRYYDQLQSVHHHFVVEHNIDLSTVLGIIELFKQDLMRDDDA